MVNALDFSKDYEYTVEVKNNSGDSLVSGVLKFGAGSFVSVSISAFAKFIIPEGESILQATNSSGDVFTLINCVAENNTIYADMIVCGEVGGGVSKIIVRYSNIAEWFLYDQDVQGNPGESISWGAPPPPINADIKTDVETFNISSDIYSSITIKAEERVIREHVSFIFSKSDAPFELSEIKAKPHQLACLLSLLIAYPISITNVWITTTSDRWLPAYFPAFERPKQELKANQFWRNSLIRRKTLDLRWTELFNRYYNSELLTTIWIRLAGMQRYKGFWEYKAFGYISLLDAYANAISKRDKLVTKTQRESERAVIGARIIAIKPALTCQQLKEIEKVLASTLADKETWPTFKEKYEYMLKSTDAIITEVINITGDDFKTIKKARDAIAHNDAIELAKYPYDKIQPVIEKITLLLTYRALNEFGISPDEFLRSFHNTINRLHYIEGLNLISLQKALYPESFFDVSQSLFERISKFGKERVSPCFVVDSNGQIQYSDRHVSLYNDWIKDKTKHRTPVWEILETDEQSLNVIDHMYVEFEGQQRELFQAYIIRI
ncbi:HEPN domain-containing protein [Pseudomonas viridiflava]|uniref:ApeA N-terminal domain 1-containing protein n=1 Tax=Pseudomonas viridiflava TaxID=33069 RepID=UPI000F03F27D|nr:HEPN domain-containing protein [Pseudomonas viridiflava]MEE4183395.1 HEPN domain-containing protein [Pseudomonas viridiflava]